MRRRGRGRGREEMEEKDDSHFLLTFKEGNTGFRSTSLILPHYSVQDT